MWQVMVYSIGIAGALGLAGFCAEKLSVMLGRPRRFVWAAAMLLSIIWPLGLMLWARPEAMTAPVMTPVVVNQPATMRVAPQAPVVDSPTAVAGSHAATAARASAPVPKQTPWNLQPPSDRTVLTAWVVAAAALLLGLAGIDLLLHYRARCWRRETVLDQQVLVSELTGPALLGAWRPQIVVPRWVLAEPAATQALILEHEQQHIAVHDPLLLRLALCIVAVVPWNLPLWWQSHRLRQAIELDCDARVLRAGAEAVSYGQVLLAVTQRAGTVPASAIAMGEPVSALERRIRQLTAGSVRYSAPRALAAVIFWAVSIGVAFALQAPALPRSAARVAVSSAAQVPTPPLLQLLPQSPPLLAAAQVPPLPGGLEQGAARGSNTQALPGSPPPASASPAPSPSPSPTVSATSEYDDPRSRERTSGVLLQSVGDALLEMVPQKLSTYQPALIGDEQQSGADMGQFDRPGFFIGNTIANLRGLDPAFGGRRLTLIDGRGVGTSSVTTTITTLSLPVTWQDAPVFERRTCFASSDCSASADLILTRADGSTQLLASQVTGDFIVLPRSHQVFACADRGFSSDPTGPSIVDLNGTRTTLPAHPGPVRFCLGTGSGDEVLLAYTMAQAGKAYVLARVFDASGALLVEGTFEKTGTLNFSVAGKVYSTLVPGP